MKKLIINETDCHGCGEYFFNGIHGIYSYDDDESGDLRAAIEFLLKIGFINKEQVKIFNSDEPLIKEYVNLLEMTLNKDKNEEG